MAHVWESCDTGFTNLYFFPLVKERASFSIDLNFFLTQALTGHSCLHEYIFRFKLSFSPACSCCEEYKILSTFFIIVPTSTTFCWDRDPALMEGRAIFAAFISRRHCTYKRHLIHSHAHTFFTSRISSPLKHTVPPIRLYRCIYHFLFLTALPTFTLFYRYYFMFKVNFNVSYSSSSIN